MIPVATAPLRLTATKVDTPDTLILSRDNPPLISNPPLASIGPVTVNADPTVTSVSAERPLTLAVVIFAVVNVDTPETFTLLLNFASPENIAA